MPAVANVSTCEVGVLVPPAEAAAAAVLSPAWSSGLGPGHSFCSGKHNEQHLRVVCGPPGRSAVASPHGDVLRRDVLFCWIDEKIVKK